MDDDSFIFDDIDLPAPDTSPVLKLTINDVLLIHTTVNKWLALKAFMGRALNPFGKSFALGEPESPLGGSNESPREQQSYGGNK